MRLTLKLTGFEAGERVKMTYVDSDIKLYSKKEFDKLTNPPASKSELSDLLARLTPPSRTTKYAYEMGVDCAVNGANETNCHFSIFSSPENTKAWEQGKKDVEQAG